MKVDTNSLRQLEVVLRQAVHAPGCKTLNRCPNQCRCRHTRSFKLNTETAACWQIADNIKEFVRDGKRSKGDCQELATKTEAYEEIARFHMSRGWEKFFTLVKFTIEYCVSLNLFEYWPSTEIGIKSLQQMSCRLKRYTRD